MSAAVRLEILRRFRLAERNGHLKVSVHVWMAQAAYGSDGQEHRRLLDDIEGWKLGYLDRSGSEPALVFVRQLADAVAKSDAGDAREGTLSGA